MMAKCKRYVVEKVVGKKVENGSVFYRIQWKRFPGQDTWEPLDNCKGCHSVGEFEKALEIHLARLHSKVGDGTASTEEIYSLNQLKCKSWMIEFDPKVYLIERSNMKPVSSILGYIPRLDVFHVKYDDNTEEYLDRVHANKNYEQAVIAFYEKRIVHSPTINHMIGQQIPTLLDLPRAIKPSYTSNIIVRNPHFRENIFENINSPDSEKDWLSIDIPQEVDSTGIEDAQRNEMPNIDDLGPINSEQVYHALSTYCDDVLSANSPEHERNIDEICGLFSHDLDTVKTLPSIIGDQAIYSNPDRDTWPIDCSTSEN